MSQATDGATRSSDSAARPVPTAPTNLERRFPIAVWLRTYDWGKSFIPDLIAAIRRTTAARRATAPAVVRERRRN